VDGREVLDRLLPDVGGMLAPGGTFLLLLLEQNRPKEVAALLEAQGGAEHVDSP
jgi:release factor glutamine methyltransferase